YCRQIVNEARVRKPSGGYTWVPRGPRDYLDAEAMAYGAAKMIGLDRVSDQAQRRSPPPPKPPRISEEETPPPALASPPVTRPTRSGRDWLGGRRNDWLNAR